MKIKVLEIGTADFWTQAGEVDGLFIEPLKDRFENLPKCRKENVAISNYEGEIDIFYIPKSVMQEHDIPFHMGGCSSVNQPHPSVIYHGFGEYIVKESVRVERIKTVLNRHKITDIDFLKIDTEGHDCIILNDFLDTCDILPRKIQFEANILSNEKDVLEVIERLKYFGYNCNRLGEDCICIFS